MARVTVSKLIVSLEKWDKVCEILNIKDEKAIIIDTISILNACEDKDIDLSKLLVQNRTSHYATKSTKKAKTNFVDILKDYETEVDMNKKYKFKLVKAGENIKDLWVNADIALKEAITINELNVIFCILTSSRSEIKKKNKGDYIELINNVISNMNRDKALDNIVI